MHSSQIWTHIQSFSNQVKEENSSTGKRKVCILVWTLPLIIIFLALSDKSVRSLRVQGWKSRGRNAWVETRECPSSVRRTGETAGQKSCNCLSRWSTLAFSPHRLLFCRLQSYPLFCVCSANEMEGQEIRRRKMLVQNFLPCNNVFWVFPFAFVLMNGLLFWPLKLHFTSELSRRTSI